MAPNRIKRGMSIDRPTRRRWIAGVAILALMAAGLASDWSPLSRIQAGRSHESPRRWPARPSWQVNRRPTPSWLAAFSLSRHERLYDIVVQLK
jgi:hypothetical protein